MTALTWHGLVTLLGFLCTIVVAALVAAALFGAITWVPCWYALGIRFVIAIAKHQTRSSVLKPSR